MVGINTVRTVSYLIICLVVLTTACQTRMYEEPSLLAVGVPQELDSAITMLPVLDSRIFPAEPAPPVFTRGLTVTVPAELLAAKAEEVWSDEGLASSFVIYNGPVPDTGLPSYAGFPLRGLSTDLAFGLQLRKLTLKKSGHNALIVPHSAFDAWVLPFTALTQLVTQGAIDPAGYALPSSTILLNAEVTLHCLSLKAGGPLLSKPYSIEVTDKGVSERRLRVTNIPNVEDGQDYGRETAPNVAELLFLNMARDPEIGLLPLLADAAWFGRVLGDASIDAGVKTGLIRDRTSGLEPPDFMPDELDLFGAEGLELGEKVRTAVTLQDSTAEVAPGGEFLSAYAVDPVWLRRAEVHSRIFFTIMDSLLDAVAGLYETAMVRPLTEDENAEYEAIVAVLTHWSGNWSANRGLQSRLSKGRQDKATRQGIIMRILASDLEALDNEEFVNRQVEENLTALEGQPDQQDRAASILIAAHGSKALDEYPIPQSVLLKALSGRDSWAADFVLSRIESGDYQPDVVRLCGAMRLPESVPYLLAELDPAFRTATPLQSAARPPRVELLPVKESEEKTPLDPAGIIRALGCFQGRKDVAEALWTVVEDPERTNSFSAAAAAEAIRSLGRITGADMADRLVEIWSRDWSAEADTALVRRAALETLARVGGVEQFRRIAALAEEAAGEPAQNAAPLAEAVDFFGEARYAPASALLQKLAVQVEADATVRVAALQSLATIGTSEAEDILNRLAASADAATAVGAQNALETLTREKSLLQGLERSVS